MCDTLCWIIRFSRNLVWVPLTFHSRTTGKLLGCFCIHTPTNQSRTCLNLHLRQSRGDDNRFNFTTKKCHNKQAHAEFQCYTNTYMYVRTLTFSKDHS